MLGLSIAGQAWVAWHVLRAASAWPAILKVPFGADAAAATLRLLSAAGTLGLGGVSLLRAASASATSPLISSVHAVEAYGDGSVGGAVAVANAGTWQFPPVSSPG